MGVSTTGDNPPPTRTRPADPRNVWIVATLAAMLFLGLAAVLRWQQEKVAAPTALSAQLDPAGRLRQPAEVAQLMRAMKLVTVEIDTAVTVSSEDESWRGDVAATVRAPAKLYYGTDLSGLKDDAVSANKLLNSYLVRVPRPRRIATEIYPERERNEVRTGWLRLRSRSGEYHLGQARRSLGEQARMLALTPEDEKAVERATREQVRDLVRAILGPDAHVSVVFADEPAPSSRGTAAAGTGGQ